MVRMDQPSMGQYRKYIYIFFFHRGVRFLLTVLLSLVKNTIRLCPASPDFLVMCYRSVD